MPPDVPRWGSEYKQAFESYFNRTMSLLAHTTSLALEKNTITLDPEVKDVWGVPAIRVTYDYHPDDAATIQALAYRAADYAIGAAKRDELG